MDGSLYVGLTRGPVEHRLSQHNSGLIPGYTETRRPVELAYSEHFERLTDAIGAERRINGSSRVKKEALIRQDFGELGRPARRQS